MELDTSTMNQFVSNVFDEMFGLPTEHLASAQFDVNQPRIVACIRISGVVEELIVVEAPVATACLISETMFDADPGTLEAEEIRDAIGEVVNIIGGNVAVTTLCFGRDRHDRNRIGRWCEHGLRCCRSANVGPLAEHESRRSLNVPTRTQFNQFQPVPKQPKRTEPRGRVL